MSNSYNNHQRQRRERFSSFTLLQLVTFLFSTFEGTYSSAVYNISNADELIAFSKSVNNDRINFGGTTVFLTEDIDFSSSTNGFEPIGKTESVNTFVGLFDGQGHIIKNLVMNSSDFRLTGVFGYSVGLTIRNVVVDEMCSFTSYFSSNNDNDVFVSSTIGFCAASLGKSCIIENVVNMADVSYRGGGKDYVITGGIAAKCTGNCVLSNCVNFGSVLASGQYSEYIHSGGIVGEASEYSDYVSIRNCVNYGTVVNELGSSSISVGGIAGIIGSNVTIENCLSAGPVSSSVESNVLYLGAIIGSRKIGALNCINNTIRNSFWTESVGDWNASGEAIDNATLLNVTGTSFIELNESSINTLYNLMGASGKSSFAIVHLNGGRIGNSTSDTLILHRSHIPVPVKEGHSFVTWCTDSNCSERCYGNSSSPCNSRDIYALWTTVITFLTNDDNNSTITKYLEFGQPIEFPANPVKEGHSFNGWDNTTSTVPARDITINAIWTINNYTLTFDFGNGTEPEMRTIKFNDQINYPENPQKEGYRFIGWDSNDTKMPARDITISAIWTINNYTLTFEFDNGTEAEVRTIKFNDPIEYPEDPKKEGYRFIGWNNNITSMPARDITIKALWTNVTDGNVAIVFGTGDLNEDEINEIIKEYVGSEFTIVEVTKTNDETVVIVKFVDAIEAKSFVEKISAPSEKGKYPIKAIGFITDSPGSFSVSIIPLSFSLIVLLSF